MKDLSGSLEAANERKWVEMKLAAVKVAGGK